jgi:HPr kinase/phosphorylase
LSGFVQLFTNDRIQVIGNTEIRYLQILDEEKLHQSINTFIEFEIPAIIITNNNTAPPYLIEAARRRHISVFKTPYSTTRLIHLLGEYLHDVFAPRQSVHGSMVDVYGVGILITGRSGIGKSEITLDLIERGNRLVADDLVIVTRRTEEMLIGRGREIAEHFLEIRGLGLVDVRRIFGIRGIRRQKRVEVVVKLVDWDKDSQYERIGLDENQTKILDVDLPEVILPINPGKNVTVIIETIAMNFLLRAYGYHPAREFNTKLKDFMQQKDNERLDLDRDSIERDIE